MKRLIPVLIGFTCILASGMTAAGDSHHDASQSPGAMSKIWPATSKGAPEALVYDAASAMEYFRTLSGEWINTSAAAANMGEAYEKGQESVYGKEGRPKAGSGAHVGNTSFRTVAAGSTVEQTYLAGSPYEMALMYHMDGPDKLLLTHFCAAKNVPVLQFAKTGTPGEIKFDFAGGTNLNPAVDVHAHAATFKIIDKDSFELNGVGYVEGKPVPTHSVYKRKSPTG
ncbi:MAG: hypothetical protein ABW034_08620 [Steroidobacteraceae bacterium]